MKLKKLLIAVIAMSMVLPATVAFAATPVYEYSFDGELGGATVVTREGDVDGLPVTFNIPKANSSITAQFAEGKNGQAVFLDGTYGLLLDAEAVGETYSVSFWVNPARFSNFSPIIQIGQDLLEEEGRCAWLNVTKTDWAGDATPIIWSRSLRDDSWPWYQKAYFAVDESNPMALAKDDWTHVVITVDGNTPGTDPVLEVEVPGTNHSKLYLNGELFGEGPVAKQTFTEDSKIYLGINCWDFLFKGLFDDFKVYNTVLTNAEAKDAMGAGAVSSTPKTGVASLGLVFGLGSVVLGAGALIMKKKGKED
ncbi:MAG: LamG domain-containing protein [Anaerolineaceae bacterium]|nr:MAG: LamG domain-containing protein [Anaerolineaceae bacterium]